MTLRPTSPKSPMAVQPHGDMAAAKNSLLKYEQPQTVRLNLQHFRDASGSFAAGRHLRSLSPVRSFSPPPRLVGPAELLGSGLMSPTGGPRPCSPTGVGILMDVQKILDELMPPRRWQDPTRQEEWVQRVSSVPATPMHLSDVIEKMKLRLSHARRKLEDIGLDEARGAKVCCSATSAEMKCIMTELLDEIIRQTTISCVDRGRAIAELRDALNAIISSHERLIESKARFLMQQAARHVTDQKAQRAARKTLEERREELLEIKRRLREKAASLGDQMCKQTIVDFESKEFVLDEKWVRSQEQKERLAEELRGLSVSDLFATLRCHSA